MKWAEQMKNLLATTGILLAILSVAHARGPDAVTPRSSNGWCQAHWKRLLTLGMASFLGSHLLLIQRREEVIVLSINVTRCMFLTNVQ